MTPQLDDTPEATCPVIVWLPPVAAAWTMFRAFRLDLPWIAAWAMLAFVGLGIAIPSAPG